jgi:hypothetical protein
MMAAAPHLQHAVQGCLGKIRDTDHFMIFIQLLNLKLLEGHEMVLEDVRLERIACRFYISISIGSASVGLRHNPREETPFGILPLSL